MTASLCGVAGMPAKYTGGAQAPSRCQCNGGCMYPIAKKCARSCNSGFRPVSCTLLDLGRAPYVLYGVLIQCVVWRFNICLPSIPRGVSLPS